MSRKCLLSSTKMLPFSNRWDSVTEMVSFIPKHEGKSWHAEASFVLSHPTVQNGAP